MTVQAIRRGGVIAAGEGSRLRADGWRGSKPMALVAGRPLIEHTLDRFRAAGVRQVSIIINEASEDCREHLERRPADQDMALDLVVRSTPSSYASFSILAERLRGEAAVISTVDAIVAQDDFRRFVEAASRAAPGAFMLGVTEHVDDDTPLWAELDPVDGRIRRLGGAPAAHVTAGFYALPAQAPSSPAQPFQRLREYLQWLVTEGRPVYGVVAPRVFNIDRAWDIAQAEQALARDAETRNFNDSI